MSKNRLKRAINKSQRINQTQTWVTQNCYKNYNSELSELKEAEKKLKKKTEFEMLGNFFKTDALVYKQTLY